MRPASKVGGSFRPALKEYASTVVGQSDLGPKTLTGVNLPPDFQVRVPPWTPHAKKGLRQMPQPLDFLVAGTGFKNYLISTPLVKKAA